MTSWTDNESGGTVWSDNESQSAALSASTGSSLVGFVQSGTGAVSRTAQAKLREVQVSITDYLPAGYVTDGTVDYSSYITKALTYVSGLGGGQVIVPPGTWGIGSQIVVPTQCQLVGYGRSSVIKAISGTFPSSTALIRLGSGTYVFNCRVENLAIACNNVTGSIGIYSTDLQEQSGAFNTVVSGFKTNGILIDGDAGEGCSNYIFFNVECITSSGGAGCTGIWIKGAQSWKSTWDTISIVGTNSSIGDHGFRIGNGSVIVNSASLKRIHVEFFANALKIEANSLNVDVDVLDSNTCTDTVENASTSRIVLKNLYRSGGTNTINDTANSVTITDGAKPLYIAGSDAEFVSGITSRGTLQQTGLTKLVGSVANPVKIDKSAAAVGTGRLQLMVGDGTGGTTADENYLVNSNTNFNIWSGAGAATPVFTIIGFGSNTGALRNIVPAGTLTLTASAGSTTVSNVYVSGSSRIFLFPTSANAAADVATGNVYISAQVANTSFTITHPNNANADKTFSYLIVN